MAIFEEAYEKAVSENGCNSGETFARSMFRAGADNLIDQSVANGVKKYHQGTDYMRQKAIEAHYRCCPNLSKDNDRMCNHSCDCVRNCSYMNDFINQL